MTNDIQRIQVAYQNSLRLGPVWKHFASWILFHGLVDERSGTSIAALERADPKPEPKNTAPRKEKEPQPAEGKGTTPRTKTPRRTGAPQTQKH